MALQNSSDLQKHVLATYFTLRRGTTVLAVLLPILLWGGEAFFGTDPGLKGSMSAYYHSSVGDVFVGALIVIGAVLYLYKGFSTKENCALNLAGTFVVAAALLPAAVPVLIQQDLANCECASQPFTAPIAHGTCALLFFGCIAYVCIFRASDTLHLINDERRRRYYHVIYKTLGGLMIILPATAAVLLYFLQFDLDPGKRTIIFGVEAVAVWTFAAYWAVKSREMSETNADAAAVMQHMMPPAEPIDDPSPAVSR